MNNKTHKELIEIPGTSTNAEINHSKLSTISAKNYIYRFFPHSVIFPEDEQQ